MSEALDHLQAAEDAHRAEGEALARLRVALERLESAATPALQPRADQPTPARGLLDIDFADAAAALRCDIAAIHAVDKIESNGQGFGADGRPIVLYEAHVFSRLTAHRFDSTHGGVSYQKWGSKPYPKTQAERWDQIIYAAKLDHDAAYKSASYGRFQIMGFNHVACGFPTVDAFVSAMRANEREHLMAFVKFVLTNRLDDELREHRWLALATRYNGEANAPAYAAKLEAAHRSFT